MLAREEEQETIPLALDECVGTIVRGSLARRHPVRAWDHAKATARSGNDGAADTIG